ncbi:pyridoxamine 5'-phosphate oxidase family protein [Ideonella sp.]|uniref:pyridoxamine 5'-phosphate oxidase family protein n=1 Tax=Ideonella sp. TaxID=1929293 RepID=UPI002B472316|nr:pyridoxamine 5'-phosphate oxidase family protein [Ideonella sp.]HJV67777.1 pyridoxamine 5'-phosphate oxidase family protein [Ideonella sp.]
MSSTPPTDELGRIRERIWAELAAAAAAPGHPWRTAVLATADPVAEAGCDARTVVLREIDVEAQELVFFTDARSPKVGQIEQRPEAVMVMWSAPLGWQLRLAVTLGIETSGLAVSSRWARLKMTPAAQDYLSPLPPGTPLNHPCEPERGSRGHFAVVTASVRRIDWLTLDPEGQRRALFDAAGARWVQP